LRPSILDYLLERLRRGRRFDSRVGTEVEESLERERVGLDGISRPKAKKILGPSVEAFAQLKETRPMVDLLRTQGPPRSGLLSRNSAQREKDPILRVAAPDHL
jgi:hypothetical protein